MWKHLLCNYEPVPQKLILFFYGSNFQLKGINLIVIKWSQRAMSVPFLHTYHRSRRCPPPVAPPSQTGPGNLAVWHSSPSDSTPRKLLLSHTYIVQTNPTSLNGFFFVLHNFLCFKTMKQFIPNLWNIIWYGIAFTRTQTYGDNLCIFSDLRISLEIFF